MRIKDKCIPCTVNQAIKVAEMVGMEDKEELLKKVFTYLSQVNYQISSTPELIGEIFALLKQEVGNDDPYKETRDKYNHLFMEQLPAFEKEIELSENQFQESVKYAIIGNLIDFNPIHSFSILDIMDYFSKLKKEQLEIDHTNVLMQEILHAHTILYLGDNCGEICLDKILIKKIKALNASCQIFFGTRGEAVVNDSVKEDAYLVGMDEYATVIDNGDSSLGTVLNRTSNEFRKVYEKADIIIAKGQANYECLSDENKNIYFLLMTKCGVIAKDIGVPELKMICMKNKI